MDGNPYRYFLPGESHGQRSWRATVHRVAKSQTWLKQLGTHACTLWISKKKKYVLQIEVNRAPALLEELVDLFWVCCKSVK